MPATWKEQLQKELVREYGQKKGPALYKKYHQAFPLGYSDDYTTEMAVSDIGFIDALSPDNTLMVRFYFAPEKEYPLHLRLFQWQKPIPLSDVLPMLENLDLRTFNERPHKLTLNPETSIWISDFAV